MKSYSWFKLINSVILRAFKSAALFGDAVARVYSNHGVVVVADKFFSHISFCSPSIVHTFRHIKFSSFENTKVTYMKV